MEEKREEVTLDAFEFGEREGQMNWRPLAKMDIDRIMQDKDINALNALMNNITMAEVSEDELGRQPEGVVLKLIQSFQLIVEYLIFYQNQVVQNRDQINDDLRKERLENKKMHLDIESLQHEISAKEQKTADQTQISQRNQSPSHGSSIFNRSGSQIPRDFDNQQIKLKCPICQHLYETESKLISHSTKRHADILGFVQKKEYESLKNALDREKQLRLEAERKLKDAQTELDSLKGQVKEKQQEIERNENDISRISQKLTQQNNPQRQSKDQSILFELEDGSETSTSRSDDQKEKMKRKDLIERIKSELKNQDKSKKDKEEEMRKKDKDKQNKEIELLQTKNEQLQQKMNELEKQMRDQLQNSNDQINKKEQQIEQSKEPEKLIIKENETNKNKGNEQDINKSIQNSIEQQILEQQERERLNEIERERQQRIAQQQREEEEEERQRRLYISEQERKQQQYEDEEMRKKNNREAEIQYQIDNRLQKEREIQQEIDIIQSQIDENHDDEFVPYQFAQYRPIEGREYITSIYPFQIEEIQERKRINQEHMDKILKKNINKAELNLNIFKEAEIRANVLQKRRKAVACL